MEKAEFQKMLDDQTLVFQTEINKVKTRLEPIAKVYDSAQGFSSGMKFIFKALVIPASIIVGIIISLKEIITMHGSTLPK